MCGDLDLVLEFRLLAGVLPSGRRAGLALSGMFPRVRFYGGTPEDNQSGVAFDEAVLIWNGKNYDWKKAIASIAEKPCARRFVRKVDFIPFRAEQLKADVEQLEELVDLQEKRVIEWDFTPVSAIEGIDIENNQDYNTLLRYFAGAKTRKILPLIVAYLHKGERWSELVLRSSVGINAFQIGGVLILMGCPSVPVCKLDVVTISEIVIMPHLTRRGPNGIWSIRRGEKHPLVEAVNDIKKYVVMVGNDSPLMTWFSEGDADGAQELELYSDKEAASEYAVDIYEGYEDSVVIQEIKGRALLDLISHADLVTMNGESFALTHSGSHVVQNPVVDDSYGFLLRLGEII